MEPRFSLEIKMDLVTEKFPRTVEQAVKKLIAELDFRDRTKIANMTDTDLLNFHRSYGIYIRTEFRLWGNDPLLKSCRSVSGMNAISPNQASFIILKEMSKTLQATNVLRVVK
jgi:hypothetical protein